MRAIVAPEDHHNALTLLVTVPLDVWTPMTIEGTCAIHAFVQQAMAYGDIPANCYNEWTSLLQAMHTETFLPIAKKWAYA